MAPLGLGGLSGAVEALAGTALGWLVAAWTGLAVVAILWASALLIFESYLSLEVIEVHAQMSRRP